MTLPPELVKIIVERLTLVPLFKLRTTSRSLNQACQGHIERRRREVEIGVLDSLFDIIHDAQEADLQTLWPEISTIREQAKNILSLIEVTFHEHQDPDNPIQIIGDLEQIWNDIITEAFRARDAPSRSELCRAARWLIQATREVETVLRPQVADVTREVSVDFAAGINAASTIFDPPAMATLAPWEEESAVLTAPTRSGPTGTRSKESVTTDTRAIVAEAVDLPETMPGGDLLTQQQEFEHQLQESKSEKSGDSIRTAAALHKLGNVLAQTGDLKQAMRYLQESLQMQRSLHGDGDHPGIAATLQELGNVLAQTGDLKQAMRYLQESLQMERSLHGDGDHPGIAVTLHELGNVLAKTGALKQAMRYLQESLQMERSLHGDGDHPGIAATLHELGNVLAKTGDLKQAMRYLQESLQMKRSLHGDGDHPGIAATLHKLGNVLAQTGDLKQAMRYWQEFLQMAARCH